MNDSPDLAVVTGGGSGIGRHLTWALADRGMRVLICGRRAAPLARTVQRNTSAIATVAADLTTHDGRASVISAARAIGQVGLLVQNAGRLAPVARLEEVALGDWRKTFEINVHAPLALAQGLLESMSRGSRILHISSGAAHKAYAGWGAYCATKASLHMLYGQQNAEWRERFGVLTGSARPGVVDTPMQDRVREASADAFPALERFQNLHREGKLYRPDQTAAFLAAVACDTTDEEFVAKEWNIDADAGALNLPFSAD